MRRPKQQRDALLKGSVTEEEEHETNPLSSMRESYHNSRHGRRTGGNLKETAEQKVTKLLLDEDDDLQENLTIDAYDDEDEQDTPVGYRSQRMSVIGRKGPRLTADSLMGKLGMKPDTQELPSSSEHTAATMDESQSERHGLDFLVQDVSESVDMATTDCAETSHSVRPAKIGVSDMDDTSHNVSKASETKRSSTIVLPQTQNVTILPPPRKGALPYTGAYSDLYDDEESCVNGI